MYNTENLFLFLSDCHHYIANDSSDDKSQQRVRRTPTQL